MDDNGVSWVDANENYGSNDKGSDRPEGLGESCKIWKLSETWGDTHETIKRQPQDRISHS